MWGTQLNDLVSESTHIIYGFESLLLVNAAGKVVPSLPISLFVYTPPYI